MASKAVDMNISNYISDSWKLLKKNWKILAQAMLVMMLVQALPNIYQAVFGEGGLTAIMPLISMVLNLIVSVGWISILIKIVSGKKAEIDDLWSHADQVVPYAVGTFLVGLLVGFGFIFFIIPGIYFSLKYLFVPYLIIDKRLKVGEALATSAKMTKGIKWHLLAMWFAFLILNILGLLALIVGVFVTSIITSLAYVKLYHQLSKKIK